MKTRLSTNNRQLPYRTPSFGRGENSHQRKRQCPKRISTIISENSVEQENSIATTELSVLFTVTQTPSVNAPGDVAVDSTMMLESNNGDINVENKTNEQCLSGDSQNAACTLSDNAVLYNGHGSDNPGPEEDKDRKLQVMYLDSTQTCEA